MLPDIEEANLSCRWYKNPAAISVLYHLPFKCVYGDLKNRATILPYLPRKFKIIYYYQSIKPYLNPHHQFAKLRQTYQSSSLASGVTCLPI